VRSGADMTLVLDMDRGRYWLQPAAGPRPDRSGRQMLGRDVRIHEVTGNGIGRRTAGRVELAFTRKGYTRAAAIHLGDGAGKKMSVLLDPFFSERKIEAGWKPAPGRRS